MVYIVAPAVFQKQIADVRPFPDVDFPKDGNMGNKTGRIKKMSELRLWSFTR